MLRRNWQVLFVLVVVRVKDIFDGFAHIAQPGQQSIVMLVGLLGAHLRPPVGLSPGLVSVYLQLRPGYTSCTAGVYWLLPRGAGLGRTHCSLDGGCAIAGAPSGQTTGGG